MPKLRRNTNEPAPSGRRPTSFGDHHDNASYQSLKITNLRLGSNNLIRNDKPLQLKFLVCLESCLYSAVCVLGGLLPGEKGVGSGIRHGQETIRVVPCSFQLQYPVLISPSPTKSPPSRPRWGDHILGGRVFSLLWILFVVMSDRIPLRCYIFHEPKQVRFPFIFDIGGQHGHCPHHQYCRGARRP